MRGHPHPARDYRPGPGEHQKRRRFDQGRSLPIFFGRLHAGAFPAGAICMCCNLRREAKLSAFPALSQGDAAVEPGEHPLQSQM